MVLSSSSRDQALEPGASCSQGAFLLIRVAQEPRALGAQGALLASLGEGEGHKGASTRRHLRAQQNPKTHTELSRLRGGAAGRGRAGALLEEPSGIEGLHDHPGHEDQPPCRTRSPGPCPLQSGKWLQCCQWPVWPKTVTTPGSGGFGDQPRCCQSPAGSQGSSHCRAEAPPSATLSSRAATFPAPLSFHRLLPPAALPSRCPCVSDPPPTLGDMDLPGRAPPALSSLPALLDPTVPVPPSL
ncbi:transcription factor SOX-15-like [Dasypus novemcinctus]|uniref:transcription factor SOX-15-like n=1 Tax=Dasypus novemcinctus TaxID=9361 RepID=UPI00265F8811|nr:protein SOX-15-like [Dasypus novemcinctus]